MLRRRFASGLVGAVVAATALQASPVAAAEPVIRAHSPLHRAAASGGAQPALSNGPHGYLPCDVANAYHLGTIQAGVNDGAGQTVAIIDPYDEGSIVSDYAAFSTFFHLPTTGLSIDTPWPVDTTAPDRNVWHDEITLDVEWVHAIAPGASIHLVKAASSADANMVAAIDYAVNQVKADVLSLSWTFGEGGTGGLSQTTVTNYDSHFPAINGAGKPVLYFASAGDAGFAVNWPAESPKVVSIGGTNVRSDGFGYSFTPGDHVDCGGASPTRAGVTSLNETVWGSTGAFNCSSTGSGPNNAYCGTGGGVASYERLPDYQSGYGIAASGRTVPDIAVLADPATGVATFQNGAWNPATGGTSLGPPVWAGIAARLNQAKGSNLSGVRWLYSPAETNFNDVQTGASASAANVHCATASPSCSAAVNYDLVTGRGTPLYDRLLTSVAPGAPSPMPFTYYLPWFDRLSDPGFLQDNIHVVNPNQAGATIKVRIGNCNAIDDTIFGFNEGVYTCDQGFGPVVITSSQRLLITQRVQYYTTFNESRAVAVTDAAPHLTFSWFDRMSDAGFTSDNVHVLNPQTTATDVTVLVPGCAAQHDRLAAGAEGVYTCQTGFGGPVTVDASQPVIASQRVKYYQSFNEEPALPSSGIAPTLYFAWYDRISDAGFKNDNIHVFGPPGTVVDVTIPGIASGLCPVQTATLPASGETYFTCAGGFSGPVIVSARGNVNIAASQRIQYNQSFNETRGLSLSDAGSTMYLSWFDLVSDPGFIADNIHVFNPSTAQPASFSVNIPGCDLQQGTLSPQQETIVFCPAGLGGPVVINTDSSSPPVLVVARVRYWDSFNEVSAAS